MDGLELVEGIEHYPDLADDEVAGEYPPAAGIRAVGAVIAQHKELILLELYSDLAAGLVGNVRLGQFNSIRVFAVENGYFAVMHQNCFAGQADNALNETKGGILGIAEYHHVAPVRLMETVRYLIDNNILVVLKGWLHRLSADIEWLDQKETDQKRHPQNSRDGFKNVVDKDNNADKNDQSDIARLTGAGSRTYFSVHGFIIN